MSITSPERVRLLAVQQTLGPKYTWPVVGAWAVPTGLQTPPPARCQFLHNQDSVTFGDGHTRPGTLRHPAFGFHGLQSSLEPGGAGWHRSIGPSCWKSTWRARTHRGARVCSPQGPQLHPVWLPRQSAGAPGLAFANGRGRRGLGQPRGSEVTSGSSDVGPLQGTQDTDLSTSPSFESRCLPLAVTWGRPP